MLSLSFIHANQLVSRPSDEEVNVQFEVLSGI